MKSIVKVTLILSLVLMMLTSCIEINVVLPGDEKVAEETVTEEKISEEPALEESKTEAETPNYEIPAPPKNNTATNMEILSTMSSEERREVNIFLSNFSEAYYNPSNGTGTAAEKISFAFIHALINSNNMIIYDDSMMGISAANVDSLLVRFFGSSVPHANAGEWIYRNGYFLCTAGWGESYAFFTVANSVVSLGNGTYEVGFYKFYYDTPEGVVTDKSVYYLSASDALGMYRKVGQGRAVLRSKEYNGKKTYELVSYFEN